jgi:hypothetical protein
VDIAQLIRQPELLDKETLYDLRSMLALHPYYQPARILLLRNLYLLHDPSFDEELRRAALYVTDRNVLFQIVEAAHYRLRSAEKKKTYKPTSDEQDRTASLIDIFLDSIPDETPQQQPVKRKPTPADATVDYVAYLLSTDFEELSSVEGRDDIDEDKRLKMNGGDLIDAFIKKDGGRFSLQEEPELHLEIDDDNTAEPDTDEDFLTETLAGIYVKQGRYEKALDIIDRINKTEGNKSRYYEDQQRFLKKLILIQNNNKQK